MTNLALKLPASASLPFDLPYFDAILASLEAGNPEVTAAYGRHVHWGFWADPTKADGSAADYAKAAERLCQMICEEAGIRFSQKVLDVGCGFGGTIASINETMSGLDITGLNIDARQLERARRQVRPARNNQIAFVEGDACKLPFPDASFDVVFAVECAFHFPSREAFFAEAARVLKPGGKLAMSDYVANAVAAPFLPAYMRRYGEATKTVYGALKLFHTRAMFHTMAAANGLGKETYLDVTGEHLPSYAFCKIKIPEWNGPEVGRVAIEAISTLERLTSRRWLRYEILSFEKQPAR